MRARENNLLLCKGTHHSHANRIQYLIWVVRHPQVCHRQPQPQQPHKQQQQKAKTVCLLWVILYTYFLFSSSFSGAQWMDFILLVLSFFRLRFYGRNEMSNRDRMERLCRYSCLLFESIWIIFVTDLVCACGRGPDLYVCVDVRLYVCVLMGTCLEVCTIESLIGILQLQKVAWRKIISSIFTVDARATLRKKRANLIKAIEIHDFSIKWSIAFVEATKWWIEWKLEENEQFAIQVCQFNSRWLTMNWENLDVRSQRLS